NGCKRTFNDLTNTLLHQSRRSLAYWILATFLRCLSCSSQRIARELGVHSRTSYRRRFPQGENNPHYLVFQRSSRILEDQREMARAGKRLARLVESGFP